MRGPSGTRLMAELLGVDKRDSVWWDRSHYSSFDHFPAGSAHSSLER